MRKLLFVLSIASVSFIVSCGAGGGDPTDVAKKFFTAMSAKNIDEATKYATKDSKSMLDMVKLGMNMGDSSNKNNDFDMGDAEFSAPKINGDEATIMVKSKKDTDGTEFTLKKEEGSWKVAFDKNTLMKIGMKKMGDKKEEIKEAFDSAGTKINEAIDTLKNSTEKVNAILDSAKNLVK
jgi:hypothetical protein